MQKPKDAKDFLHKMLHCYDLIRYIGIADSEGAEVLHCSKEGSETNRIALFVHIFSKWRGIMEKIQKDQLVSLFESFEGFSVFIHNWNKFYLVILTKGPGNPALLYSLEEDLRGVFAKLNESSNSPTKA